MDYIIKHDTPLRHNMMTSLLIIMMSYNHVSDNQYSQYTSPQVTPWVRKHGIDKNCYPETQNIRPNKQNKQEYIMLNKKFQHLI